MSLEYQLDAFTKETRRKLAEDPCRLIALFRASQQMTQVELSEELGMSVACVPRWEGGRKPDAYAIAKFVQFCVKHRGLSHWEALFQQALDKELGFK